MGILIKKLKNLERKDWLSRNEKVVDEYIKDPFCMQIFKNQFFVDLAYGVMWVNYTKNLKKLIKTKLF